MIIKLNKKVVEKYLLEKEMNIAAAQSLFDYCFYSRDVTIKDHKKEIVNYLELNLDNDEDKYFYNSRIEPAIKEISSDDYKNNYYRIHINPIPYKNKQYELKYLSFKPYQCLPYEDVKISKNFVETSQIGYFLQEFKYLAVLKNDVVWMSTDPNEINTMRDSINAANGNVLAFGLGLGYYPIMCAIKDDVKSVTIVEKDQAIIDIFNKHILPLFDYKNKIKIVHEDAFDFGKKDLSNFDYLFIDIWHNPEDGLPLYLRFKKLLKNKQIKVAYWLEKSILAMYRRCFLTVMEESLLGYKDSNYLKAKNDYDKIINDLYFKTKNVVINNEQDLIKILQDNYLLKLV